MFRLGHIIGSEEVEHSHPPVYAPPSADSESRRVVATVPGSDPDVFLALARCLGAPISLLYVLHTPRGEAKPGRYQSPELSIAELEEFVSDFRALLCGDGRFDLWAYNPDAGHIVWDRHNLIFGYGDTERYIEALRALGFVEGKPQVPSPHTHFYRFQLDDLANDLLARFSWSYSALRPEDQQ